MCHMFEQPVCPQLRERPSRYGRGEEGTDEPFQPTESSTNCATNLLWVPLSQRLPPPDQPAVKPIL